MQGVTSYLIARARGAATYRRRVYGIEPSRAVQRLISSGGQEIALGIKDSFRLFLYILYISPREMLKLFWGYVCDNDTPGRKRRIARLALNLRNQLSPHARVIEGYFERRIYSRDLARVPKLIERILHRTTPLLVVQPNIQSDISTVISFASERQIPVYPRGIASSAFGGVVPTLNGIVLDFSGMRSIEAINPDAMTVTVEPGARWADIALELERYGLAPMTTPTGLFSTVAGWACTGGLGIDSFSYGHFKDAIVSARVVYMNGDVRTLEAGDSALNEIIGTEGQFAVLTELCLRVRSKASEQKSFLYSFESVESAFDFIDAMISEGHRPSHLAFYDQSRMREENALFRARFGRHDRIVREHDSVFFHFDSAPEAAAFEDSCRKRMAVSDPKGASFIWSERYFPLKSQRMGPSMLASEAVLPRSDTPHFIRKARKVSQCFGVVPSFEVFLSQSGESRDSVVISSFLCDSRAWHYGLKLLLVQLLTYIGILHQGRPYGFGIWNSPFIGSIFSAEKQRILQERKREVDPLHLLNPSKFFRVRSRLFNIPGLLFIPRVHMFMLKVLLAASPALGLPARLLKKKSGAGWDVPDEQSGRQLLLETVTRCASCGACISVCPAYAVTTDELVSGRSKLRIGEALLAGGDILAEEAQRAFQCLHCGLCEEVCQTSLPLRACYRVIEDWVADRCGRPDVLIQEFLRKVEEKQDTLSLLYGMSRAEWKPEDGLAAGGAE